MTQWKRDSRPENVRTIGDFQIFSEVDKDEGTAHVIRFPDGQELRVLPDERSGRKRSNLVRQAVEHLNNVLEADTAISPQTYLFGLLLESGFTKWEWEVGEVSIEEWLTEWFKQIVEVEFEHPANIKAFSRQWADQILHDLKSEGWTIERKGGGE